MTGSASALDGALSSSLLRQLCRLHPLQPRQRLDANALHRGRGLGAQGVHAGVHVRDGFEGRLADGFTLAIADARDCLGDFDAKPTQLLLEASHVHRLRRRHRLVHHAVQAIGESEHQALQPRQPRSPRVVELLPHLTLRLGQRAVLAFERDVALAKGVDRGPALVHVRAQGTQRRSRRHRLRQRRLHGSQQPPDDAWIVV